MGALGSLGYRSVAERRGQRGRSIGEARSKGDPPECQARVGDRLGQRHKQANQGEKAKRVRSRLKERAGPGVEEVVVHNVRQGGGGRSNTASGKTRRYHVDQQAQLLWDWTAEREVQKARVSTYWEWRPGTIVPLQQAQVMPARILRAGREAIQPPFGHWHGDVTLLPPLLVHST